jgi:S-DNA-T family DNA segregation ATPase FtsK/SpoIIIE
MTDPVNGRELVNAVFEAELVDDPPQPVYYQPRLGRFTSWWLRSPRVPAMVKSRRQMV